MPELLSPFRLQGVRKTVLMFICLNAAFWLYFWTDLGFRLVPYQGAQPEFHGHILPEYVWYGRAVPYPQDWWAPPLRLMRTGQQPAYSIVKFISLQVVNRVYPPVYVYRGETFGGVSFGGYQVFATMLLSFFQWYAVARLVDRLIPTSSSAPGV